MVPKNKPKTRMGTSDLSLGTLLLNAGVNGIFSPEKRTNDAIRSIIPFYDDTKPHSPLEAMLLTQMLALHLQSMDMLNLANRVAGNSTREDCLRMATKLISTFTACLGAYERFRRDGKQSIRVDHVHVHSGGQAIVGNVERPEKEGVHQHG